MQGIWKDEEVKYRDCIYGAWAGNKLNDPNHLRIPKHLHTFAEIVKKLLAVILSLTIISQSLVYVGIGIYYHVNKQYISQQLCENRNNPQMHCNGHCYLSKQLKKAEEGETKSARIIKEKDEIISTDDESVAIVYFPSYSEFESVNYNSTLHTTDDTGSLIKPPAV